MKSVLVTGIQPVQLADQRGPGESAAQASGLYPHGFGHALDDQRVDLVELAAGLRPNLDLETRLALGH